VTIEDGAHGIGYRIVEVITIDEDCIQAADRAATLLLGTCAFEQLRQEREDGRRLTFGCGRFANGIADLALGHRHTRETVDHEHDAPARMRKVFGDASCELGATNSHQG